MRIIFTLFLALAAANALELAAESYDEHHLLRGPNDNEDDEDRDLLSVGSASQSYSFSVVSSHGAEDFCFDYRSRCIEAGLAYTSANTYADASGNSIAFAQSIENLFLLAFCDSFAESYALTCAFTKVDGDIQVDTKMVNWNQVVTLGLNIKAASTTFAKASSVAQAAAYTAIKSQAFTTAGVAAFCNQYSWFPTCSGFAGTSLEQIATAEGSSLGVASASAGSVAIAQSGAFVMTAGSKYSYVNGLLSAYVKAWSFAEAGAVAKAFADSYEETTNDAFAAVCAKQYESICGDSSNNIAWCGSTPEAACAEAKAKGSSMAYALALACAQSFIEAFTKASSFVFLTANVDCSKVQPVLTWTTTSAGIANSCSA